MQEVLNIFNDIKNTNSRNEKEDLLRWHQDNELFKKILYFVFNPYIVTGVSKNKINKVIKNADCWEESFSDIEEVMDHLEICNTGRDLDIARLQNFISDQPEELREFATQIITKNISIGVNASTINKVYENFIPVFDVMLAEKYAEFQDRVTGDFILTEKLDGCRSIIFRENNEIKMLSRQGKQYEGFVNIEEEMMLLSEGYVYDGEFIATNEEGLCSKDLYRKTTSICRKKGIKKGVEFHIFDIIPIEDFKSGICNIPCIERKTLLHRTLKKMNFNWIKEVEMLYVGKEKSYIDSWLDTMISNGKEGIMLNVANAPYECKRSQAILKVKKMQSADLRVIGFEEGKGRLKGTLGRINVNYKGNIVGVGSGYSDQDRKYIWGNRDNLYGCIIETQFFEESTNSKTGEVSLRFPVFKCIRDDKTEESYY